MLRRSAAAPQPDCGQAGGATGSGQAGAVRVAQPSLLPSRTRSLPELELVAKIGVDTTGNEHFHIWQNL